MEGLFVRVAGSVFSLVAGQHYVIGRDPESSITVDHALVSRRHAGITQQGGVWTVVDFESSNGIFVDGHRVPSAPVGPGTRLQLGDGELGPLLEFGIPSSDVPAPTPLGRLTQVHSRPSAEVVIGRDPSCGIVLDDVLVSRRHARLVPTPSGVRLDDLDSHNGTFVNGRRQPSAMLAVGDVVSIGRHRLRLSDQGLEEYQPSGGASFSARNLVVEAGGNRLVDDVGFALDGSSFLGVVGPSGAGKSTLLGALTGLRPAQSGTVSAGPHDLYRDYDLVRHDIGFVPQDDVLHRELTVVQALEYAAELRFPSDTSAVERRARVDDVITELGLGDRRDLRIEALSGGQRKRVSVALELLTKPSLLILDEPTSGLDPGYERALMQLLRDLADAGRTVIVVTHSVDSLHLCDRVLVLAVGGSVAYLGPPQLAPATLGAADFQELFRSLSDEPSRDWAGEFRRTIAFDEYVAGPLRSTPSPSGTGERGRPSRGAGWFRQVSILVRRNVRVLAADTRTLALLLASGPVLGVMILISLAPGELGQPPPGQIRLVSQAPIVLLVLTLAATLLGAANSIREIVKELPIFRRERAVGLSVSAYIVSKFLVYGCLTFVQIAVLVPLALARQDGPPEAVALGLPLVEMTAALAMTALAAMALGLVVSAAVRTTDQAMTMLPVVIVAQLILVAAAVFPGSTLEPFAVTSSAQWGFAATASTSELNQLNAVNRISSQVPVIDTSRPEDLVDAFRNSDRGEPRWNHDASTWWGNVAVIAFITVAFGVLAAFLLRRTDPL